MTEPKFFVPARRFTVAEIASVTGAKLLDPSRSDTIIERLASAGEGGVGALVFVDGKRNAGLMQGIRASAVLCSADIAPRAAPGVAVLVVDKPQQAFLKIAILLFPDAMAPGAISGVLGISPHAIVHETAELEENVTIEAGAIIGAGARIGSGTIVGPQAIVGAQCSIGRDCSIGAQSTLQFAMIGDRVILHPGTRIGQDGFGFLPGPKGLVKNPQLGRVIIQNDVEIGSNTTVDRGALTDTIVGEGTKVDNLVQIAHNVKIGRFCVIAAHCGISGSVTIGDGVMLGGRVGIADHLTIGDGAQLAAASGVMNDIPAGGRWAGSPAQPIRQAFREIAALRNLAKGDWKGTKGDE